jgi:hypothetical protein
MDFDILQEPIFFSRYFSYALAKLLVFRLGSGAGPGIRASHRPAVRNCFRIFRFVFSYGFLSGCLHNEVYRLVPNGSQDVYQMKSNVWAYRGQLEINNSEATDTRFLEQRGRVAMFRVLLYIITGLIWYWNTRLMFCWLCITVYQYSEINVIYFLSSVLRIKGLYMLGRYLLILTSILYT